MAPRARRYTHDGHTRTIAEWAQVVGMSTESMRQRIQRLGIAAAVSQPVCTPHERGVRGGYARAAQKQHLRLPLTPAELQALQELKAEREQLMRRLQQLSDTRLAQKFELSPAQVRRA